MIRRRAAAAVGSAVAALVLSGCTFSGVGSLPLPLRAGTGDDAIRVVVELAQVSNLVPNAEVKVGDVTVGSVVATQAVDWHARLTVSLDGDVRLPANATARVAQKSLLGAEHLELSPPVHGPAVGTLRDGDVIPLERTGRYPETEEVLAALGVVLNGSGLQQLKTITSELDQLFAGRETDVRELLTNLDDLVGTLDAQSADIVRAMEGLDRFSRTLADEREVVEDGLDRIPPALEVLVAEREDLTRALTEIAEFGDVTTRLVHDSREDLLADLAALRPTLRKLADTGTDLTDSASMLVTYPFPANTTFPGMMKGDYGNLFAIIDVTPSVLAENFVGGFDTPLPGGAPMLALPPLGGGEDMGSPLDAFGAGEGADLPLPVDPPPVPPVTPPADPPADGLLDGLLPGGDR